MSAFEPAPVYVSVVYIVDTNRWAILYYSDGAVVGNFKTKEEAMSYSRFPNDKPKYIEITQLPYFIDAAEESSSALLKTMKRHWARGAKG